MRIGNHMTAEPVGMAPREVYTIHAKDGAALGYVEWYPRWRKYVFQPDQDAVFSADCLRDLATFLRKCKAHQHSAAEKTDLQGLDIHEQ